MKESELNKGYRGEGNEGTESKLYACGGDLECAYVLGPRQHTFK